MAECSFARCQQERRAIRKELQRWTKNMVYILGLERVAEELMGRRKWKIYQDGLLPKRNDEVSSDEDSTPSTDPPPALKIKTIEQINTVDDRDRDRDRDRDGKDGSNTEERALRRPQTILESLINQPATQPKVEISEEPTDWKPPDKCYFCVDGDRPEPADSALTNAMSMEQLMSRDNGLSRDDSGNHAAERKSPASESDSSSVSGAKSPAAAPPLLQHLLQLQAQSPQAIAQFQQMLATLAALGSGLMPPALTQAFLMQRLAQARQPESRLPEVAEKPVSSSSPSLAEQPLDLSAKSSSSTSGTPPPVKCDPTRLKRPVLDNTNSVTRRTYTEDELQSALRDIQSGKLGTRRAAAVYGIPRSTLRNKVNKFGIGDHQDSEPDSDPERTESPPSVILKIPSYPPPDEQSQSPATSVTTPVTPITPILPPHPPFNPPSQLLLPPSVYADQPSPQHLFTSLSDVIAKSISQKFLDRPMDRQQSDLSFMRPDRHVSVIKNPADNRSYPAPSNSRAQTNNNGQAVAGGKGTRPKRGKYRNYDRDSLVEAVKAVQRGEMSVHRAGSYYGVPHSTLEYKVKERHLMRPRKREPKPQQDNLAKPQPPKPPPPKPPTKPFTNGLTGPDTPGYPPGYPHFWPPGQFPPPPAPDLYASHMMRRLREEAPPPANGSFLEGIIRSSLERPGAALLQRLTAEPRPPLTTSEAPSLLRRLAGEPEDSPPARRPRLDSSTDVQLAADLRDVVQRLRADKLRPRNGTPTPPPPPPPAPRAASPPAAPPDRA